MEGEAHVNKSKTNFIIDVIMFLGMMFLTGTGYVRKYILLGGSASREAFGQKMDMYIRCFAALNIIISLNARESGLLFCQSLCNYMLCIVV